MDRSWMDEDRHTETFINGVKGFIQFAFTHSAKGNTILCPCKNCVNCSWLEASDVQVHLICDGFVNGYRRWEYHGEASYSYPANSYVDVESDEVEEMDELEELDDMGELIRDMRHEFGDLSGSDDEKKEAKATLLRKKKEAEILEKKWNEAELRRKDKEAEQLQKEADQLQKKKEAEQVQRKKEQGLQQKKKEQDLQQQKKGAAVTQKNHQQGNQVILYNVIRDHSIPVAKATVLSTDRKKIVGGRELGTECCEVVVDYIMKRDAILPRHVGNVTTIGHAQGRTIAWPHKHLEVQKSLAKQAPPPQEE